MEKDYNRPYLQQLTHMRALAGDTVSESLLRTLWLARLPNSTQSILATLSEDDLGKLAIVADKIAELAPHSSVNTAIMTPEASESAIARLESQVTQLTTQVNELASTLARNSRSRKCNFQRSYRRSRSRERTNSYKERTPELCFYHVNFGEKARKCQKPSAFGQKGNE